jgi:phage terminase small subunit
VPRTVKKTKDLRTGEPAKPVGLSERASAYWDRLLSELRASGIELTPGHRAWLEMASTIADDMADAATRVKKDGAYVEGKAGLVAHPASKRLDALRRDYIKVLAVLGLRAAVPTPADAKEETLAELLGE